MSISTINSWSPRASDQLFGEPEHAVWIKRSFERAAETRRDGHLRIEPGGIGGADHRAVGTEPLWYGLTLVSDPEGVGRDHHAADLVDSARAL